MVAFGYDNGEQFTSKKHSIHTEQHVFKVLYCYWGDTIITTIEPYNQISGVVKMYCVAVVLVIQSVGSLVGS